MKTLVIALLLLAAVTPATGAGCPRAEGALEERWRQLWGRLQRRGAEGDPEEVFRRLAARYCEPHRAYHDLAHVEHVLAELDAVRHLALDPEALELALWFHDAVYDLGARDNEEASARLASEAVLALGLPQEWAERVSDLVLATRHTAEPPDGDARLMVDIDLAILGQPAERFDAYEEQIRAEYAPVIARRGVAAFNAGRAAILRRFLERPAIYSSDHFRQKYEAAARANLRRSIERLEDPSWTDEAPEGHNQRAP